MGGSGPDHLRHDAGVEGGVSGVLGKLRHARCPYAERARCGRDRGGRGACRAAVALASRCAPGRSHGSGGDRSFATGSPHALASGGDDRRGCRSRRRVDAVAARGSATTGSERMAHRGDRGRGDRYSSTVCTCPPRPISAAPPGGWRICFRFVSRPVRDYRHRPTAQCRPRQDKPQTAPRSARAGFYRDSPSGACSPPADKRSRSRAPSASRCPA